MDSKKALMAFRKHARAAGYGRDDIETATVNLRAEFHRVKGLCRNEVMFPLIKQQSTYDPVHGWLVQGGERIKDSNGWALRFALQTRKSKTAGKAPVLYVLSDWVKPGGS